MAAQPSSPHGRSRPIGIYSKTVHQSPVIEYILRGRIRHRRLQDAVFVGHDSIQVKQVLVDGHLEHVATKSNFDAKIRAAAILSSPVTEDDGPDFLKMELDEGSKNEDFDPPDWAVLVLDSDELVFTSLRTLEGGGQQFMQITHPLPAFATSISQVGHRLAVDGRRRVVAAASMDGTIVLCSVRPPSPLRNGSRSRCDDWGPTITQRVIRMEGSIQGMEFLIPPRDNDDHAILLLIVVIRGYTKVVWVEWQPSIGLDNATVHPAQDIGLGKRIPQLVIPSKDASFLLTIGEDIDVCTGILTGFVSRESIPPLANMDAAFPGTSRHPLTYTGWTKPERSAILKREKDVVWLVREDGCVIMLDIHLTWFDPTSDIVGTFSFHAGKAFAAFDQPFSSADIVAAAGDMDNGLLVAVGGLSRLTDQKNCSRSDAMEPTVLEIIPNWASVTDMISTSSVFPRQHHALNKNSAFVTSGRQPNGSITELRSGIEGRISITLPEVRAVMDTWILPDPDGTVIILLSRPHGTQVLRWDGNESLDEPDTPCFLDMESRTLTAGAFADRQLVQVTGSSLRVSMALAVNFEDSSSLEMGPGTQIIAASLVSERSAVIVAERSNETYSITRYDVLGADGDSQIRRAGSLAINDEVLCLSSTATSDGMLAAVMVASGDWSLYALNEHDGIVLLKTWSSFATIEALWDQIVLLRHPGALSTSQDVCLVAGQRNGDILTARIRVNDELEMEDVQSIDFGNTAVKLTRLLHGPFSIFATSDLRTGVLAWDASRAKFDVQTVWLTDANQPSFVQKASLACAQVPAVDYLLYPENAGTLIVPSADTLQFVTLAKLPSTVPRKIAVHGTPQRCIYATRLKYFICVSMVSEISKVTTPRAEERRQLYPVVNFCRSTGTEPAFHHKMQPGERVNALIECTIQRDGGSKKAIVMVGGSYINREGKTKGRITYLRMVRGGTNDVVGVEESKAKSYKDVVYALAVYDATTHLACVGDALHAYRLTEEDEAKSWLEICEPMRLSSRARQISVDTSSEGESVITVTTVRDSIVMLKLVPNTEDMTERPCKFVSIGMAPRADGGWTHTVLPSGSLSQPSELDSDGLTLLSTVDASVVGLTRPIGGRRQPELKFEASLNTTLTRLTVQPSPTIVSHVLAPKVVGTSTSGAMIALALIGEDLWRRLFWLQRLVEWSTELSPHSCKQPRYRRDSGSAVSSRDRALPIGLRAESDAGSGAVRTLNTSVATLGDMHINGDVLARVIRPGGVDAVKSVLRELATKDMEEDGSSAVAEWVSMHLDEELTAVDEIVDVVRELDEWL